MKWSTQADCLGGGTASATSRGGTIGIAVSSFWHLATLITVMGFTLNQTITCDEPADPDACLVTNRNISCSAGSNLSFDFQTFKTLQLVNSSLVCSKGLVSISAAAVTKSIKDEGYPINLVLVNSTIKALNVSIDLGALDYINQTNLTLNNSSINSDMTVVRGMGWANNERLDFTGACLKEDLDSSINSTNFTDLWKRTYGYPSPPAGCDMSVNPDSCMYDASFFGTGGDNATQLGGGRVYLRVKQISILDSLSSISSSANQQFPSQEAQFSGTGGTVIIACNNITSIGQDPKKFPILARGGSSENSGSSIKLGGGGRVYILATLADNLANILVLADVGSSGSSTTTSVFYGQYGTVYLENSTFSGVFVSPRLNSNLSNCFTVLPLANISMDENGFTSSKKPLELRTAGLLKAILVNQPDSTSKPKDLDNVRIPILTLQNTSLLYLAIYSSLDVTRILPVVTASVKIHSDALLIPSGNIQVTVQGDMVMNRGNIRFPLYNYPSVNYKNVTFILNTESDFNMSNSTISFSDSLTSQKRNTVVTFLFEPRGTVNTDNAIMSSDTLVLNYSAIKNPTLTGFSLVKGSSNYCPVSDTNSPSYRKTAADYMANLHLTKHNAAGGLLDRSSLLTAVRTDYFDSSFIVLAQTALTLQLPNVTDFGYIGIYSADDLRIAPQTVLSANASGCSPNVLVIQSTSSKYLKICKVIGGSHVGRGGLGSQKNFENCKYVLSTNKPGGNSMTRLAPGMGGQKNHQMETDKSGFGGGVVALYSSTQLTLQGSIFAEGGTKSEKDYTMIAGGAGGTVSLNAVKMFLDANISVRGGLGDSEVGNYNRSWEQAVEESCFSIAATGIKILTVLLRNPSISSEIVEIRISQYQDPNTSSP